MCVAALVVVGIAGIGYAAKLERKMSKDENRLISITESVRPICVGRFIIDVPRTAEIVYGPARLPVEIWRQEGEGGDFAAAIKKTVEKSESRRWLAYGPLQEDGSLIGAVWDGIGPDHKIVFGVGRAEGAYYNVQSLIKLGADLYLQEYEAYGEKHDYLDAVRDSKEIAQRLRSRQVDEIPSDPGVCIDGAFMMDPERRYMVEAVSVGIRLKEFSDVHISIEMTKKDIYIASDSIEPRLKAAEHDAIAQGKGSWYRRIKVLNKGQRRVGNWDGFEVGARIPAQEAGGEHHEFAFLSHSEPKNPMLPVLDIQLHTGVKDNVIGGVKPSITDAEAIYLWDKMLGSIRPRPVQPRNSP